MRGKVLAAIAILDQKINGVEVDTYQQQIDQAAAENAAELATAGARTERRLDKLTLD